jgi:hypothetical protein
MAIARWVGAMDVPKVRAVLDGKYIPPAEEGIPDGSAPGVLEVQPMTVKFAADPAMPRTA